MDEDEECLDSLTPVKGLIARDPKQLSSSSRLIRLWSLFILQKKEANLLPFFNIKRLTTYKAIGTQYIIN
ncbi:MAG: hypothetical protein ACI89W_000429 [Gammaproteobacteria bacterium]|jgi:hypothetical protein